MPARTFVAAVCVAVICGCMFAAVLAAAANAGP